MDSEIVKLGKGWVITTFDSAEGLPCMPIVKNPIVLPRFRLESDALTWPVNNPLAPNSRLLCPCGAKAMRKKKAAGFPAA
jgi:hypothetical protein